MYDEKETTDEEHGAETTVCEQCRRELALAADVLTVEQGVIGPRGVVPLNDVRFFCCEECLSAYFGSNNKDIPKMPRRVP